MIYNLVHSILREAENINAYGLFSFFLFFGFFIGVLVWALALRKNHLNHMRNCAGREEKLQADKIQS